MFVNSNSLLNKLTMSTHTGVGEAPGVNVTDTSSAGRSNDLGSVQVNWASATLAFPGHSP